MKPIALLLAMITMPAMAANVTQVPNPFGATGYKDSSTPTIVTKAKPKAKSHPASAKTAPSQSVNCGSLPTTCYAMTSCAQAQAAFKCGNTRLDRDHDGIPCDKLCQ